MKALFDFAARCGEADQLWKSFGDTYQDAITAREPQPGDLPGCPVSSTTAPAMPSAPNVPMAH